MSWYHKMMTSPDKDECVLFDQSEIPRLLHSNAIKRCMRTYPHKVRLERGVETTMATIMEALLTEALEHIGKTNLRSTDVHRFIRRSRGGQS